jgi:hypothetical protein
MMEWEREECGRSNERDRKGEARGNGRAYMEPILVLSGERFQYATDIPGYVHQK